MVHPEEARGFGDLPARFLRCFPLFLGNLLRIFFVEALSGFSTVLLHRQSQTHCVALDRPRELCNFEPSFPLLNYSLQVKNLLFNSAAFSFST